MSDEPMCVNSNSPELAERYVAGRMSAGEAAEFEDHFVACPECQREIRLATAVRAALRRPRTDAGTPPGADDTIASAPTPRRRSRRILGIGAGLALAAGIGAIAIMRASPSAALTQLGGVREPPVYLGIAVRGTPNAADSIFDAAMADYSARRYQAAAGGLRAALAAGADSVPVEFFLGASALMAGEPSLAVEMFGRVIARGESPYRTEALFFSAKGLLRLGRGREALALLRQMTPGDPALAAAAAALADSVTRALAR